MATRDAARCWLRHKKPRRLSGVVWRGLVLEVSPEQCVSNQGNLLGGKFRSTFDRRQQATVPEAALLSVLVVVEASAGLVVDEVAIAAFAELLEVAAALGNADDAVPFKGSTVEKDAITLLNVEVADHIRLTPTTASISFIEQEVVGSGTSGQPVAARMAPAGP